MTIWSREIKELEIINKSNSGQFADLKAVNFTDWVIVFYLKKLTVQQDKTDSNRTAFNFLIC